ncbi:MAG: hypothetical protein IBX58_17015 [Roseovarius sp.]|nr:hypothetical protein [Roseovarius sp.]
MPRTIDQQIAEAENRVQRLKTKKRTKDTRRKIIVGATIIPAAFKDKKLARYLVRLLETSLTREVDKQDAEPLLDELRKFFGDDQA